MKTIIVGCGKVPDGLIQHLSDISHEPFLMMPIEEISSLEKNLRDINNQPEIVILDNQPETHTMKDMRDAMITKTIEMPQLIVEPQSGKEKRRERRKKKKSR